jgi:hypothetical protein
LLGKIEFDPWSRYAREDVLWGNEMEKESGWKEKRTKGGERNGVEGK